MRKIGDVVEYWLDGRIEIGHIVDYTMGPGGEVETYRITFGNTGIMNNIKPQFIVE